MGGPDQESQPLPAARNFSSRRLNPRGLIAGFTMHFRDAGLPWLFAGGFLLMRALAIMFSYIGFRLLGEPYLMRQALVGLLLVMSLFTR